MALHVRRAAGLLLAVSGLFIFVGPASSALGAEFGIVPGSFTVRVLDAEGQPETLAGSHPDLLQLNFALNLEGTTARDLEFELPPGLGGNPAAVPRCPRAVYENEEECSPESQVGIFEVGFSGGLKVKLPLFELEPRPGQFISFGSTPAVNLPLSSEIRPSDFGITLKSDELPEEPISEGHFELWGVPADHQVGTTIPRLPLLTLPATCGPMDFTFRTRSRLEGAPSLSASTDTGAPLAGCGELSFDPGLGLQLSEPLADSPTGLRMDLVVPEEAAGSERADAPIENVTVELPSGVGVSPGGAVGLVACTDAQLGLGNSAAATCPQQSKIGTAEFASPALGGSVDGTIYLGQEHPGERFRNFVVASVPGIALKFVSTLRVNPATGRLSTVIRGLPEVPIQRIGLAFDGGPRALLASPLTCGPTVALARFEPYGGGPAVESSASAAIASRTPGSPCTGAAPFSPQLSTADSTPQAGRPATFSTTLHRAPGEQLPRSFSVTLPEGMTPRLGTIQPCLTAGACPNESRVGSVLAEIGSGASVAPLHGSVYLTGPYRRAPFGLLMEFRAAIGAFDLGSIALRAGVELDGSTGRLTVSTAGLPDEFEGVPIRFQTIALNMDRQGFIRNPTSCSKLSTDAVLESQGGASATATSPLQLRGCDKLGFKPSVRMAFTGSGQLHKGGAPTLRVTARLRPKDTNLRGMTLSLPPLLRFGIGNSKEICSRHDAREGACPSGSAVGTASVRTPLLAKPLNGSVYMVQPASDGGLPDMWVSVAAMGVRMELRNRTVAAPGGRFVTKMGGLPDLPLSTFTMRLGGSKTGIFTLAVGPCRGGSPRRFRSDVEVRGQDGARRSFEAPIGMKPHCSGNG
ncbi:MAG TPA: hypothetical protein VGH58_06820 [Solirubrobacterales bacterium]